MKWDLGAYADSEGPDQTLGRRCQLTKSFDTIIRQGSAKAQMLLYRCVGCRHLRISDMIEGTFSIGVTQMSPASVAQLDAPSDWRPGGRGFNPPPRSATFFRGD